METEVISETSSFSELKQLDTAVKHVGHENFLFWRNKTAVTYNRCLEARKWQGMEKIPSKKLHNFCRSLNIISTNKWAARVWRGIYMQDMRGYKIQKIDTKFFVDMLEWVRIFWGFERRSDDNIKMNLKEIWCTVSGCCGHNRLDLLGKRQRKFRPLRESFRDYPSPMEWTPCRMVSSYRHFGEDYRLHLQGPSRPENGGSKFLRSICLCLPFDMPRVSQDMGILQCLCEILWHSPVRHSCWTLTTFIPSVHSPALLQNICRHSTFRTNKKSKNLSPRST